MNHATFRALTIAALAREAIRKYLAGPLGQALAQVDVRVKDQIDQEDVERGATAELCAYYYGEQDEAADGCEDLLPPVPGQFVQPRIVLFADKIDPTVDAVAKVLIHELGHHVGFSEFELVEGLGL